MKSNLTLNGAVREAVMEALVRQLEKKPFSAITVRELADRAGVSRSSVYRNFHSKEQILVCLIREMYDEFFRSQSVPADLTLGKEFLLPRFRFVWENRHFFTLLRNNNLLFYAFEHMEEDLIHQLAGIAPADPIYFPAMMAGSCAAVIRRWIDGGFAQTPEEMVEIFDRIK